MTGPDTVKDSNFVQVLKISTGGRSVIVEKFVRTERTRLSTRIETRFLVRMSHGWLPNGDVSYTTVDLKDARKEAFKVTRQIMDWRK